MGALDNRYEREREKEGVGGRIRNRKAMSVSAERVEPGL